jgi:dipeptidyl aminopeptidase/acylaminoacyl peptidase
MKRYDSDFSSNGLKCAGWLYLPEGVANPPVVVMAHGIAAERTFGLEAYAQRFAESGLAVFSFDYRNFGDGEGQPRN